MEKTSQGNWFIEEAKETTHLRSVAEKVFSIFKHEIQDESEQM